MCANTNPAIYFFYWIEYPKHLLQLFPGGALALSNEFPTNAPRIIQGAIKFLQSDGHMG